MIDTNKIKAGMIATILLKGEHKMNKRGNPLFGRVTRDHRLIVNVAGPESYTRSKERAGEAPAGKKPWYSWVKDGIVKHDKTGKLYLVGLPTDSGRKIEYLVDGRKPTQDELDLIREFTPKKDEADILCFSLENVENVA